MNARTANGQTPLNFAVIGKQKAIAELLLDRRAEINLENQNFTQLLNISASGGIQRIVDIALKLAFSPDYEEVYWSTNFTEFGFYDIGFMKKENGRWSAPKIAPFSEKTHARDPVFSYDGKKLYFSSTCPRDVNAGSRIIALFIAPHERYLILELFGDGGYGGANIYICYKMKDGSWTGPINLGPKINTGGHERFPSVTPDGNYLAFLRVTDGSDFYWEDAKILEDLKPKEWR
jgi:WD40-like Beta Propeller Repeat